MHSDPTHPSIPAWTALLSLGDDERRAFLAAANAYSAAATFLRSTSRSPGLVHLPDVPSPVRGPASVFVEVPAVAAHPVRRRPAARFPSVVEPALPASAGSGLPPAIGLLPILGGAALDLRPRAAFTEPAFLEAWRPGRIAHVYIGSTPGMRNLTKPLKLHAYRLDVEEANLVTGKLGTAHDISHRMADLGRIAYGSLSKADPTRAEPGFKSWTAEPFPVGALEPSVGSPVRVVGNGLEVVLPASTTFARFDQALARAVAGSSLAGWAMGAGGRAVCAAHDVDPARLVRGTPGPDGAVTWATEIVLIRPRHDAPRLLRLCEQIIIDLVLAEPTHKSEGRERSRSRDNRNKKLEAKR